MGRKKTSLFTKQVTVHLTDQEMTELNQVIGRLQIPFTLSMNQKLKRLIIAAYMKGLRA